MKTLYHVEVNVLVFPFSFDIKNLLQYCAHIRNIVFVYSSFSNSSYGLFCAWRVVDAHKIEYMQAQILCF